MVLWWFFCTISRENTNKNGRDRPTSQGHPFTEESNAIKNSSLRQRQQQYFANPPLHLMVSARDDVFCEAHGFDAGDFAKFKADAIPRLKFSSQFDTWLKTGRPIEV